MSLERKLSDEIGAFDVNLRRCQDIEFGYRASEKGIGIYYEPTATARHNHALSLKDRCLVERRNQRYSAFFYLSHPYLAKDMRRNSDRWPIDWRQDKPTLLARKGLRQFLAWGPVLGILRFTWNVSNALGLPYGYMRWLYWKIVGSYQYQGRKEGIEIYENIQRDSVEE